MGLLALEALAWPATFAKPTASWSASIRELDMATDLATMLDTVCVSVANSASSVRVADTLKRQAANALEVGGSPHAHAAGRCRCQEAGGGGCGLRGHLPKGQNDCRRPCPRGSPRSDSYLWSRQIRVEEEEGMHNSCLVVGASAFELRQWAHHGHVSFWLPLCEGRRQDLPSHGARRHDCAVEGAESGAH